MTENRKEKDCHGKTVIKEEALDKTPKYNIPFYDSPTVKYLYASPRDIFQWTRVPLFAIKALFGVIAFHDDRFGLG